MTDEPLKRTPLHAAHLALGARMVPFGGWDMPVQYAGIIEEHRAVRTRAGLFDVSHMGEAELSGPGAPALIQRLVTNDLGRVAVGQAMYTPMCTPEGGIIDDLLVYRLGDARFMLVVNAANTDADLAWIRSHLGPDAALTDRSAETALLALQGPRAPAILARLTTEPVALITYYWFREGVDVAGRRALVSRTGYTGEDGFELYVAAEDAVHLWNAVLEAGRADGVLPAGLGARDTLRLEAGLLLHGSDMDRTTTPIEVGLGWTVKLQKGEFIGAGVLRRQKAEGTARRLAGFVLEDRAIARHGFPVLVGGRPAGTVTSGSFGPTVEKSIGLGFVPPAAAAPGGRIAVEVRGRAVPGAVAKLPFYTRPKTGAA
ncbi:MAG TPA: glycine cleavage system aminomethyltransferase GcvT [bacterium]|nr:glycine cleavage system aminomethyltransferase GcvT [bacterium]